MLKRLCFNIYIFMYEGNEISKGDTEETCSQLKQVVHLNNFFL